MTTQSTVNEANVVIVEWTDLVASAPSSSKTSSSEIEQLLEQAYGPTGTGILAIRGVPGFVEAKNAFLPEAHKLATLPAAYLEEHLTDAKSLYNAGWSHGKEKLGANKPPDTAKGSFYFNPISDLPGTAELREQYPYSYPLNVWPDESVLPGFTDKARAIGKILLQACEQVARHVDALAAKSCPSYPNNLLYNNIQGTDKVKARLLYYFPLDPPNEQQQQLTTTTTSTPEDSWIGWHNDSGFLTALAGDLYVDHETGQPVDCPDPAAGLYVVDRNSTHPTATTEHHPTSSTSSILHVQLPSDCMAVQMGECTQIVTGGTVQATPHCVRGVGSGNNNNKIARVSLPCFVDTPPNFGLTVPDGMDASSVLLQSVDKVPPLSERWNNRDTFGTFLQKTFSVYYNWKAQ